jgi:hypothetical protein
LLLQRDAEQRHGAGFVSHHVQKLVNSGAFLNIVRQVKMGIVEFVIVCLRANRRNAVKQKDGERRYEQQRLRTPQGKPFHIYTFSTFRLRFKARVSAGHPGSQMSCGKQGAISDRPAFHSGSFSWRCR